MHVYAPSDRLTEALVMELSPGDLFGILFETGKYRMGFAIWERGETREDEASTVLVCSNGLNDPDEEQMELSNDWVGDARFVALDHDDTVRINTLRRLDRAILRIVYDEIKTRALAQIPDYKELANVD